MINPADETPDIWFTTAHKAKGLEFDTVKVSDDFLGARSADLVGPDHLLRFPDDEKNIFYVAVSRRVVWGGTGPKSTQCISDISAAKSLENVSSFFKFFSLFLNYSGLRSL